LPDVFDETLSESHVLAVVAPELLKLLYVLGQFPDDVRVLVNALKLLSLFLQLEALLNCEFARGSVEQLHLVELNRKNHLRLCQFNQDVEFVLGQNC
jgi:hypothetical protein